MDVAVSESDVKGHRLHPTASHLNLLVSLVRSFLYIDFSPFFIFLFFNLIVCVSHTHSMWDCIFHAAKIVDLFFFFIFKALIVSAGSSGYTDLVFGVQWSWTEAEERAEQLQGLSDCVSRRLDQGTIP